MREARLGARKSVAAEHRIALLRFLVVAQGALAFAMMDRGATTAWLVYPLVAVCLTYSLCMLFVRPYLRWPALVSSYATVTLDTAFIALWVYATGGSHSPFFLLAYLSVFAVAFRSRSALA